MNRRTPKTRLAGGAAKGDNAKKLRPKGDLRPVPGSRSGSLFSVRKLRGTIGI